MWYDSLHSCNMVYQGINEQGLAVYRCACGTVMTTGPFTNTTTSTAGFIVSLPITASPQMEPPEPTRQPVPAAFLRAFEDDEVDPGVVPLTCACGTPLTITKYSPESTISGTFCPECGEQHWIRWSDGIVRHGGIEGKNE